MDEKDKKELVVWVKVAGQCSFIPIYLALFPIAFRYIGVWLDGKFGTDWLSMVFLLIGVFSGFRQTYFLIKRISGTLNQ